MGYFGSKVTSGLCQPLIAMMPPHSTYIEAHLGGGAIMQAQTSGVARHRHRPRCPRARCVRVRLPRRARSRLRAPVPRRVHVRGHGAPLLRPAVSEAPPQLEAAVSVRLRGVGPRGVAGASRGGAVSGDGLGVRLRAVRDAPRSMAAGGAPGDEPSACGCTSPSTGCTGRATQDATSPTASASNARPTAGAVATRRCRTVSASRCSGR